MNVFDVSFILYFLSEVKEALSSDNEEFLTFQPMFCLLKGKMFLWVVAFQDHVSLNLTPRNWAPCVVTVKVHLTYLFFFL